MAPAGDMIPRDRICRIRSSAQTMLAATIQQIYDSRCSSRFGGPGSAEYSCRGHRGRGSELHGPSEVVVIESLRSNRPNSPMKISRLSCGGEPPRPNNVHEPTVSPRCCVIVSVSRVDGIPQRMGYAPVGEKSGQSDCGRRSQANDDSRSGSGPNRNRRPVIETG